MRIEIERSGGFTGIRLRAAIDTETLPSEQAKELESLVDGSNFFKLPVKASQSPGNTDRFNYKISIEVGGEKHAIETSDEAAPDSLRPLLRRLMVLTRSGGRS